MNKRFAILRVVTAAWISLVVLLAGCGKPETAELQAQEDMDSKSHLRAIYDPIHFRP